MVVVGVQAAGERYRARSELLDVTKEESWAAAMRFAVERFGGLDVLMRASCTRSLPFGVPVGSDSKT